MSRLKGFFAGEEKRMGLFYPTNYLIAVFPDFEVARTAEQQLQEEGFSAEALLAVPGADMLRFAEENRQQEGLLGLMMGPLSQVVGTEANFVDLDVQWAQEGKAFLAVHTPTRERKEKAWTVLEGLDPISARSYSSLAIEELRGPTTDQPDYP